MTKTRFGTPAGSNYANAGLLSQYLPPPYPLGNVFFVQSTHANATNSAGYGYSPDAPLATLDYAVGLCTAENDDVIIALPGHVETVSAAGGLDLDVAGIRLIGVGRGTKQPKIDFTSAAGADVDIDAANISIEGFQFEASFADLTACVDVNATDCTIKNCRFLSPTTDENALIWILGATGTSSHRLRVEDCLFEGKDNQNTHCISFADGTANGCAVINCVFHAFAETGIIGGTGALTNVTIIGNYMQNADTDADACIILSGSPTGIVARNIVGAALAGNATTNISVGAGCVLAENYSVDTGDVQGVLDPIAT